MWDDALIESNEDAPVDPRVLVAIVARPRDWEAVQREGWYRIPLARAPLRLACEYLAFYHTAAFPTLRHTITWYAPVLRYDVLRRIELLPDEPTHPRAQQRYYRLTLGPLEALPRPIPSERLRRVAFIGTTLSRLLSAGEINDLWERSSQREALRRVMQTRESNPRRGYRARRAAWQRFERNLDE